MAGFITFCVVFVAVILIALVLVQRTKAGGGLGAVSGGQSEALFGAEAGNVLGKTTAWLIAIFFGLTLLLTMVEPTDDTPKSMLSAEDNEAVVMTAEKDTTPADAAAETTDVPAETTDAPAETAE